MSWGIVGAVAAIAGPVIGGAVSSSGARSAANSQARSTDAAIRDQQQARAEVRQDLAPFRQLGVDTVGTLSEFVANGPNVDFERSEGFRDIQNSAAAGGKLQSGGTLRALTEFNSGLNARNRSQRFNELFNLTTLGANAAAGQSTATQNFANNISDLRVGRGDAIAAGRVGQANAIGGAISDLSRVIGGLQK